MREGKVRFVAGNSLFFKDFSYLSDDLGLAYNCLAYCFNAEVFHVSIDDFNEVHEFLSVLPVCSSEIEIRLIVRYRKEALTGIKPSKKVDFRFRIDESVGSVNNKSLHHRSGKSVLIKKILEYKNEKNPEDTMKLYYDDSCSFCTRWAKKQGIPVKPLKSKYQNLETMVLEVGNKSYFRSDAAIRVLASRGGIWRLMHLGRIVPRFLRDWVYDLIGKVRHKLL